jgi:hypothetical protein
MGWKAAVVVGILVPLGAAAEPPALADVEPAEEWWAGHQVTVGSRKIPLIGELQTRSDAFLLARVVRDGDALVLEQKSCRLDIAEVAGVQVAFRENGESAPMQIRFRREGDRYVAEPWLTAWADEDVDRDGNPGATVTVDAPICDGLLYVGGRSLTRARGEEADGTLRGEVLVDVAQKIYGTSGACLSMMAKDSEDKVRGTFAYARVPEGSTCASLLAGTWPVRAPEPRKAAEPAARRERLKLR